MNMYLSDLADAGVTETERREIASALAHYAKADPKEKGQLREMLILGVAGGRTPPRTPKVGNVAPDLNAPRVLTREERRAVRSYERNIQEHEEKLERYKRDPYSQDNDGRLSNAPSEEVKQRIMRARIEHLEKEIKTFRENVSKITGDQS